MWVARDKSGLLLLFKFFPKRLIDSSNWRRDNSTIVLDSTLFPNIKWEDEPIEVSLIETNELNVIKHRANAWIDSFDKGYEH